MKAGRRHLEFAAIKPQSLLKAFQFVSVLLTSRGRDGNFSQARLTAEPGYQAAEGKGAGILQLSSYRCVTLCVFYVLHYADVSV